MIDWLQKISGNNTHNNMEKNELLELRKEVIKLRKRFTDHNEEKVDSASDEVIY